MDACEHSTRPLLRRKRLSVELGLLLCNAVDRPHAPNQRFAIDRYCLTSRKKFLKRFDGASVVGVTEYRRENDVVGDVKVCVAGRQTIQISSAGARTANDTRHRESNDLETLSGRVSHRPETREIVLQYLVVCVLWIVFESTDDHVG